MLGAASTVHTFGCEEPGRESMQADSSSAPTHEPRQAG
jgi:hypothetical protein